MIIWRPSISLGKIQQQQILQCPLSNDLERQHRSLFGEPFLGHGSELLPSLCCLLQGNRSGCVVLPDSLRYQSQDGILLP